MIHLMASDSVLLTKRRPGGLRKGSLLIAARWGEQEAKELSHGLVEVMTEKSQPSKLSA